MVTNTKTNTYQLHHKGFVGGYDFDADYVDFVLGKNKNNEVNVLIDSLGGQSSTALSIFSAFKLHGNVNVHFVGMNASTATITPEAKPNSDFCSRGDISSFIRNTKAEPNIVPNRGISNPIIIVVENPFFRYCGFREKLVPLHPDKRNVLANDILKYLFVEQLNTGFVVMTSPVIIFLYAGIAIRQQRLPSHLRQ
jgi:hypothetical protein